MYTRVDLEKISSEFWRDFYFFNLLSLLGENFEIFSPHECLKNLMSLGNFFDVFSNTFIRTLVVNVTKKNAVLKRERKKHQTKWEKKRVRRCVENIWSSANCCCSKLNGSLFINTYMNKIATKKMWKQCKQQRNEKKWHNKTLFFFRFFIKPSPTQNASHFFYPFKMFQFREFMSERIKFDH